MMERTGAGTGRAHRDINGRRRSARAGGSGRRRSSVHTGGAIDGIGDSELISLRVDDVDVGAVDTADLVAPFGVGVAGDLDRVRQIRRGNVYSQRNIRWRPRHKVPEIETEVGGIGINAGPLDGDGGPGRVGTVGSGIGDFNGSDKRSKRGDQRDHGAHHLDFRILLLFSILGRIGFRISTIGECRNRKRKRILFADGYFQGVTDDDPRTMIDEEKKKND